MVRWAPLARGALLIHAYHDRGVILAILGEPSNGNVAITYSLDLEDATALCDLVKLVIDGLQKGKDLRWLSRAAPSSESNKVGEHYGNLWEQVGNWLGLED